MAFRIGLKAAVAGAALAALSGVAISAPAEAGGVKVSVLSCNVHSGWGFVIGSTRDLWCAYHPDKSTAGEHYTGKISKFGVDIGYTEAGIIVWAVVAPTTDLKLGALEGTYAAQRPVRPWASVATRMF